MPDELCRAVERRPEAGARRAISKGNPMQFETFLYADISTGYLTAQDCDLLGDQQAPNHLAEVDPLEGEEEGPGSFYHLPCNDEDWVTFVGEARAFGFSQRFLDIMEELYRQDIPYVRFDADGGEIEGLEWAQ